MTCDCDKKTPWCKLECKEYLKKASKLKGVNSKAFDSYYCNTITGYRIFNWKKRRK